MVLCSDLGSRDRLLPGAGASLWHLAVAGRLPDPLSVVALDAVVAYKVIVTHQPADVKHENAANIWGSNRSRSGHHHDSNGVRVIVTWVCNWVPMFRPGEPWAKRKTRSTPPAGATAPIQVLVEDRRSGCSGARSSLQASWCVPMHRPDPAQAFDDLEDAGPTQAWVLVGRRPGNPCCRHLAIMQPRQCGGSVETELPVVVRIARSGCRAGIRPGWMIRLNPISCRRICGKCI